VKKNLLMALMVIVCALATGSASSHSPGGASAKDCTDCGCSDPNRSHMCPKEKGKRCYCPKP
jgi:hypothetical protein